MSIVSRGFHGRRGGDPALPPGQYLTEDFPVLSAGPTPRVPPAAWTFTITNAAGASRRWTWREYLALPAERPHVDIHCVTKWSKLGTDWEGVSLDTLFEEVEPDAPYAMIECYGGYTTNLPVEDLLDGKAWVAHGFGGEPLHPEHGGPARLLVPHLYFWKSAKWVSGIRLMDHDEPGFWEAAGYHNYGDPWREQRYEGD
ncbi:sulfite oxidase-like oxidoreductase [Actinomadura parmotrematis]|uniref:Sulfite oxidase-like oxidoreductase n=1 Tax=Actinomadura parmotrematis TaxID=2864039 RepID=A0ABS7G2E6_9ACTN|nr:sulfite oxidase-like oxidoreductase [Actinomadura parmotrematis]MBW8486889.1 sulfite oxidase-like oxidoreductase [Actinomadura parmotrematis]